MLSSVGAGRRREGVNLQEGHSGAAPPPSYGMKRLLRWLFNAAAVASILLCVAAGVVGVRSFWATDFIQLPLPRSMLGFNSCYLVTGQGGIGMALAWDAPPASPSANWVRSPAIAYGNGGWRPHSLTSRLGFDAANVHYPTWAISGVLAPAWFLALVAAALPAAWVLRWRRRRRIRRPGLCRSCGYDLTGNLSGVCPECGTGAPAAPGAPSHRTAPPT
jgi:hypothetical protein